jgi:hypothetical protein
VLVPETLKSKVNVLLPEIEVTLLNPDINCLSAKFAVNGCQFIILEAFL